MKVIPIERRPGSPGASDGLRGAREELRRACALLCTPSPDAMTACGRALRKAAAELQEWLPAAGGRRGDAAVTEAVLDLRRSVVHAQRLLQAAAEYHSNWLQRMSVMAAGYTPDGRPGTIEPGSRMSLRA